MTNKYCFCLSGHLGAVVLEIILTKHSINIQLILTDKKSDEIVTLAKEKKIPVFAGNPRNEKASLFCCEHNIIFDYFFSVNYLFILEEDFLNRAKLGFIFMAFCCQNTGDVHRTFGRLLMARRKLAYCTPDEFQMR